MDDLRHLFDRIKLWCVRQHNTQARDLFCAGSIAVSDGIELVQAAYEALPLALTTDTQTDTQCVFFGFPDGATYLPGRFVDNLYPG